jgi:catechol 2,3-dioxygenase-like lactoylglutathione lyase family enzyme
MKLEHVALLVADPVAVARWYEEHLGMRVVRKGDAPGNARFLADEAGERVLEVYAGTPPLPAYASMVPLVLHVAFAATDVGATRARLIAAGATPVGEIVVTPAGDRFAMLRDPWGLAVQLVSRRTPMIAPRGSKARPEARGWGPAPSK